MTRSFEEIIDLWPSPEALAADVGAGVEAVRKWKQRKSIPAEYWLPLVTASRGFDQPVSYDELATAAAQNPRVKPTQPAGAAA